MQREVAHIFPETHEIIKVALDFGPGALGTSRTHDKSHALRHLHIAGNFLQATAVSSIGNLAGNPATSRSIRHENAVASCKR